MLRQNIYAWLVTIPSNTFNRFQSGLILGVRWWIAWQFLKSGWLKVNSWDTTLFLFKEEYRVLIVPPEFAAIAGTVGELIFPILLIVGLFSRLSAVGLSAVNAMAVYAYAHVLLGEGFEAALGQHILWGFMLIVVVVYGPGKFSLDHLLSERQTMFGGTTDARATAV